MIVPPSTTNSIASAPGLPLGRANAAPPYRPTSPPLTTTKRVMRFIAVDASGVRPGFGVQISCAWRNTASVSGVPCSCAKSLSKGTSENQKLSSESFTVYALATNVCSSSRGFAPRAVTAIVPGAFEELHAVAKIEPTHDRRTAAHLRVVIESLQSIPSEVIRRVIRARAFVVRHGLARLAECLNRAG